MDERIDVDRLRWVLSRLGRARLRGDVELLGTRARRGGQRQRALYRHTARDRATDRSIACGTTIIGSGGGGEREETTGRAALSGVATERVDTRRDALRPPPARRDAARVARNPTRRKHTKQATDAHTSTETASSAIAPSGASARSCASSGGVDSDSDSVVGERCESESFFCGTPL